MKKGKIIFIAILAFIVVSVIGITIYANTYYRANDLALSYMESSKTVQVIENNDYIAFEATTYDKGIIMYPGGKVDEKTYAVLAHKLALENILVVIVKMPLKLAVFNINGASKVLKDYTLDTWYLMGHSLGGAMGASYLGNNQANFKGLILLAAYATNDLKDTNLDVLLIVGENDLVLNKEKYESSKKNLPLNYKEELIIGGNHAYFGSYGEQDGDGKASITANEQMQTTVNIVKNFILS